jgi:hypothetical protein
MVVGCTSITIGLDRISLHAFRPVHVTASTTRASLHGKKTSLKLGRPTVELL